MFPLGTSWPVVHMLSKCDLWLATLAIRSICSTEKHGTLKGSGCFEFPGELRDQPYKSYNNINSRPPACTNQVFWPEFTLHDLSLGMYMYIHIRHPCNPPSENPSYGPEHIQVFSLDTCWTDFVQVGMLAYTTVISVLCLDISAHKLVWGVFETI